MKKPLTTDTLSQQDVAEALARFCSACPSDDEGNEGALRFASELLGVSEDQIWEWMQETV